MSLFHCYDVNSEAKNLYTTRTLLMRLIVIDNGNGPPTRILISKNMDGKLLSQLEWP